MKDVGVLLLHGFGGSRDDVRSLYDAMKAAGYHVRMPVLRGHEGDKKAFAKATHTDWIGSGEAAFLELQKTHRRIVVVGFSMGGLLAVQLYNKYRFDGLVTINTPVFYWDFKRIFANLRFDIKTYAEWYLKASVSKPVHALYEFSTLLRLSKPLFRQVTCPAMVIQARDDDTVHYKSACWILKQMQGRKKLVWFCQGGHLILLTSKQKKVARAVLSFLKDM